MEGGAEGGLDGGDDRPVGDALLDGGQAGGQPLVRARSAGRREDGRRRGSRPGGGRQRAAQVEAPAGRRSARRPGCGARLATATRSLRAADQPSETWSSCIALVGSVSVLAGTARRRFSATIAACVYWPIIRPELTPASGREERRQATRAARVEQAVGAPLAERADVGDRDGQEVGDGGDRRAVEVAARLDPPVGQHDRVVDERHQLALGDRPGVLDGVPGRAVDLRRAAQRVGVLDPVVAVAVAGHDRRAGEQARAGSPRSTAWPTCGRIADEVLGERPVGAEQRLGRSWRRRCRPTRSSTSRSASARTSMPSIPSVPLIRARPSLARSTSGAAPASATAVAPSTSEPSATAGRALAEQHQRRRRQRGEVAAGAERAVLAHDRRDAGVEQGEHRLDDDRAGAREAHRQAAGAQQDHRPHDLALDLRAHPGGVRADERRLQLGRALGRDHRVGQRAEPGRHAVHRLGLVDEPVDDGRAPLERRPGLGAERRPRRPCRATATTSAAADAVGPEHERAASAAESAGDGERCRAALSGA